MEWPARKSIDEDRLLGLPRRTLRSLDRVGDRIEVPAGAVLVPAGTPVRWAWIVLSGELVIESETRVQTVGAGRPFGVEGVLTGDSRPCSIAARTAASVMAVGAREVKALLATDAAFASWITRHLARDAKALRDELRLHAALQVAA